MMRSSGQLSLGRTPSSAATPVGAARTPQPASRAGAGGPPRTPATAPRLGAGVAAGKAATAAAAAATPPTGPTSDRLANIFNRSPLQQAVPTLQDGSR